MACANSTVYLGYEEDVVSEKNLTLLNYSINKIGGFPDWPPLEEVQLTASKCPLCGLHRLLVVQCYAPLDSSVYHRTLYVFACVSPNCWTQSESWCCIRSQILDKSYTSASCTGAGSVAMPIVDSNLTWCSGADQWDESDNGDAANGNIMSVDNLCASVNSTQRSSDEDDESNSLDVETVEQALGGLHVFDARNANMSPVQGAVGAAGAPSAAAELEGGDEPGLVTVDTPTAPHHDLHALLHQTAELPVELRTRLINGPMQFVAKYVYVETEGGASAGGGIEDRVDELLNKYKRENGDGVGAGGAEGDCAGGGAGGEEEAYEEARPLHGDKLFHAFLTRLREHPGQILRYSRGAPPLLGAPLSPNSPGGGAAPPSRCGRCGARTICELQLLPGLARALHLHTAPRQLSHLHLLSVLVFTCSDSCWSVGDTAVEEAVIFQPEIF